MVCVKLLSIFCTTVYEEVKGIALRGSKGIGIKYFS